MQFIETFKSRTTHVLMYNYRINIALEVFTYEP